MPEGHSVARLARQFESVFVGAHLAVSSPQGRFAAGASRLDGQLLTMAHAHGKQMFLSFANDLVMRVHLGLYGAWSFGGDATFTGASSIGAPRRVGERETADDGVIREYAGPPAPVGAVRVRLVSEHVWADLRGPTACEVLTEAEVSAVIARLGPDPLDANADREVFRDRIQRSSSFLATLLMNQSVIAGVGNVYRAELLFRQRLNPWLRGNAVSTDQVHALWAETVLAMQDGVRDGRIVTTDPSCWSSSTATSAEATYVYRRAGEPCRICLTSIAMQDLAARKLYWCPVCQA